MTATDSDSSSSQERYHHISDKIVDAIESQQALMDRSLLTIPSAFLFGSVAFIGNVVDLSNAEHLWVLRAAWILLAATPIMVMLNIYHSIAGLRRLLPSLRALFFEEDRTAKEIQESFDRVVRAINITSVLAFCLGVTSLAAFVLLNLENAPARP